ncbi:class I SAM-dependent methyltransferase [bacterium]|nr:class I SAM-dependent methyltransferase [bacterium]
MPTSAETYTSLLMNLDSALGDEQCGKLGNWLALVEQGGRVMNLTGLKEPAELAAELVVESLRLLGSGLPDSASVLDIGSGQGAPVIPLAVAAPQCSFLAVEVRQRRADFLLFAARRLRLANLSVAACRVEALPAAQSGPYDVVVSRAFASPLEFIRIARTLLSPAGEIRGICGDSAAEIHSAAAAHGLIVDELYEYEHGGRRRISYRLNIS